MQQLSMDELGRISTEAYRQQPKKALTVVLDNVRSGHNVGAAFRISDAFLIEKIYLTGICPTPPHREARRSSPRS